MTVDVFSAILSYATVPLYVAGVLLLIYIIARTQLGFSLTGEVKQQVEEVVQAEIAEHRPQSKTTVISYLVVVALFALLIGSAVLTERKQHT